MHEAATAHLNVTILLHVTIKAHLNAITHLHVAVTAHSFYSVVLCLSQGSTHQVLVLTAQRQFTLSPLLSLEENKSLLSD